MDVFVKYGFDDEFGPNFKIIQQMNETLQSMAEYLFENSKV